MSALVRPGDVLRGMDLELHCVRVGRKRDLMPDASLTPAAPRPSSDELQERIDAELLRLRSTAERGGYEAGLREGRAAAAKEADAALDRATSEARSALEEERQSLRKLAMAVTRAADDLLHQAEDDIVALCFETLCRVLSQEIVPADCIRAQVRAARERLPAGGRLAIHVNPVDAQLLAECDPLEPNHARWVPDAEVNMGGCVVRHEGGGLDMRFDTALEQCREALGAQRARRARAQT